jgi:hypothetical protein
MAWDGSRPDGNRIYVVPVPGDHEVAGQIENENAWPDNVGNLILDNLAYLRCSTNKRNARMFPTTVLTTD